MFQRKKTMENAHLRWHSHIYWQLWVSCTGIFATDSRWNGKWKAPGKLGIEDSKLHLVSWFQGKTPIELKATPEEPTCFNSTPREHTGTKISAGREWTARNFHAIPQIFEEELRRFLKEREKCQWMGQDEDFQGSAGAQGQLRKDLS